LGFDFVILDLEHSALTISQLEDLVRAADVVNLATIVRVPENNPTQIQRALDTGASGVQVPGIQSVDELKQAACAARYHPHGSRGLAFSHRAARFGSVNKDQYLEQCNSDTIVVAHVESKEAVEQLSEWTAVPGIDVLFIGPVDLTQSLGIPGAVGDPTVQETIDRAIARIQGPAVPGIFAGTVSEALKYCRKGVRYVALSSEQGLMARAAAAELHEWKTGLRNMTV